MSITIKIIFIAITTFIVGGTTGYTVVSNKTETKLCEEMLEQDDAFYKQRPQNSPGKGY